MEFYEKTNYLGNLNKFLHSIPFLNGSRITPLSNPPLLTARSLLPSHGWQPDEEKITSENRLSISVEWNVARHPFASTQEMITSEF